MSHVVAVSANQSSIQDTIVMNQDTDMKYLDTNMDHTDGCLAKDKWGQYTGWTRVYKNGDNASWNYSDSRITGCLADCKKSTRRQCH